MWPRKSVQDGELAARIQPVDGPAAFSTGHAPPGISALEIAAIGCGAVDVALSVDNQATLRPYSVFSFKDMNHAKFAGGSDFEQRSTAQVTPDQIAIGLAPVGRHAVDVTLRIHGNRRIEAAGLRCFSGNKQHGFLSLRVNFEDYRCAANKAVPLRRAIEVTLRVPGQPCVGTVSIVSALEAVENGLVAGAVYLEHRSATVFAAVEDATKLGSAVDIAIRVSDDGIRNCAVCPSGEPMEDGVGLCAR